MIKACDHYNQGDGRFTAMTVENYLDHTNKEKAY
jgi:hypothetical protein